MPAISVIMPVYNAGNHLRAAIESILHQTFTDFEFLIFNDGSTDNSKEIILSYQDNRISFYDAETNEGYTKKLNAGLEIAAGKYIARMDSDDVSLPGRFEAQYNFMEANPEIAMCGTFFDFIGGSNGIRNFNWVSQTEPDLIKINLLFDCGICHPTVMIRNAILRDHPIRYDESYEPSEDYELWIRLAGKFKLANLHEKLLRYRISEEQVSNKKNDRQRQNKFIFITGQLKRLHIEPSRIELLIHDHMFYGNAIVSFDYLPKLKSWIRKLTLANERYQVYEHPKFVTYLDQLLDLNRHSFRRQLARSDVKTKITYCLKALLRWNSIR